MKDVTCAACGAVSKDDDFSPSQVPGMGYCPVCDAYVPNGDDFYEEK